MSNPKSNYKGKPQAVGSSTAPLKPKEGLNGPPAFDLTTVRYRQLHFGRGR